MLATIFGADSVYVLIIIALVLLFGGTQLPKLARGAGEAMKEFKKAHNEVQDMSSPAASVPAPEPPAATAQPVALPPTAAAPPVAAVPQSAAEERVTLSRAELDALLADREARVKSSQGGAQPQN